MWPDSMGRGSGASPVNRGYGRASTSCVCGVRVHGRTHVELGMCHHLFLLFLLLDLLDLFLLFHLFLLPLLFHLCQQLFGSQA